jgi:hypothetical protein
VSRSTYIYIVCEFGVPIAAFTVKHELETWLEKHPPFTVKDSEGKVSFQAVRDVWRIRDCGTHNNHIVTNYMKEK